VIISLRTAGGKPRDALPLAVVRPARQRHRSPVEEQLEVRRFRWPAEAARLELTEIRDALFTEIDL
jgi:hypothetical protein